jgi:AhpD family alkylhydroperoxidase
MADTGIREKVQEILAYRTKFAEKYPDIAHGFAALQKSVMQDGRIGAKEKELIAVGISVGMRCAPCIYAHTRGALKLGATPEEIMEAASVAILMAGGPGMAHVVEVLKAIDAFTG